MRLGHYLLLVLVWAALCLVNLGRPSLWDIDEGNNAEAAREMAVSDNYIVPTFNYQLRVDKPALLYWCQVGCYEVFGVNEFSARLPSALAALLTALLAYELGRRMYDPATGLLASLMLVSSISFCAAAHFANPDALLLACTTATFWVFWRDYESGRSRWMAWCGVTTGLGMLAKGPVGLVLPSAVIFLFLVWSRQWRRYKSWHLLSGVLLFTLVAVPWYAWVGAESRGEFLRGFFLKHNVGRFQEPMENHRGPVFYYLLVLIVGAAPWSALFPLGLGHLWSTRTPGAVRRFFGPGQPEDARWRFLLCWVVVYLVFFTAAGTKLPNYILPIYPPLLLLLGRFLVRWQRGEATSPSWSLRLTLGSLVLTGGVVSIGLLIAGGQLWPSLMRGRPLQGLADWAWIGLLPVLAAGLGLWLLRRGQAREWLAGVTTLAAVFVALAGAGVCVTVDRHKAARPLSALIHQRNDRHDIIVCTCHYFQPSLVFYCRGQVTVCHDPAHALELLRYPIPVYLFVPAPVWEQLRSQAPSCRELGRHHDLYRRCDVILVTNQPE